MVFCLSIAYESFTLRGNVHLVAEWLDRSSDLGSVGLSLFKPFSSIIKPGIEIYKKKFPFDYLR